MRRVRIKKKLRKLLNKLSNKDKRKYLILEKKRQEIEIQRFERKTKRFLENIADTIEDWGDSTVDFFRGLYYSVKRRNNPKQRHRGTRKKHARKSRKRKLMLLMLDRQRHQ